MKQGEELYELKGRINDTARMRTWSFVEHKTLFIGDILYSRKDEKKYLISTIEGYMDNKIEETKCLYDFNRDHTSKLTFHNVLEKHSNWAMIIETAHAVVVGYYSGAVSQEKKVIMNQPALIISLNNRKYYQLKEGPKMRAITYDP